MVNDVGLLETMLEQGLIDDDQHQIVQTENIRQGTSVKEVLLANGFVDEATFTQLASQATGIEVTELSDVLPDFEALRRLPADMAIQYEALPLSYCAATDTLEVCVPDLENVLVLDALRAAMAGNTRMQFRLANRLGIVQAQDRFYGFNLSLDDILVELEDISLEKNETASGEQPREHPIVRLVDALLVDACKHRASDIHFEPEAGFLRIRYRIDGVMKLVRCIHKRYWSGSAARLKVLSSLNIAETRAPQDGAFSIRFSTRRVDIRISTFPTVYGENVVLRLLDTSAGVLALEKLGFAPPVMQRIARSVRQPHGVFLVVGPTGCGKTTTLYSLLDSLNTEKVNIVTLEDPVEYMLPMVRQCSVNGSLKMGFAEGIRSILRQDPDIILVGEVRDSQTAELTFRAAMTGHQVFASVHACSALGAYQRLIELGLPREQVYSQVSTVVSQRLLRQLCPYCKEPDNSADAVNLLNDLASLSCFPSGEITATDNIDHKAASLFRAGQCRHCNHQGYTGRLAVAEVLIHDQRFEKLLQESASSSEVSSYLTKVNFLSLRTAALQLVVSGMTSLEEVERVTGPLDIDEFAGVDFDQPPVQTEPLESEPMLEKAVVCS